MAFTFEDIKKPLGKVIKSVYEDESKFKLVMHDNKGITAEKLEIAIGNHLCDDYPGSFGITKDEGHKIRAYFQATGTSYGYRDYILLLHEEFPKYMSKEDPKFIKDTNKLRKEKGLAPIKL